MQGRTTAKKAEAGNIPYVISAFMCGCGLSIGQKEVGEKTNEVPEIPELLELIDITDCFVTIDAIGTQKDIMDKRLAFEVIPDLLDNAILLLTTNIAAIMD